MLADIIPRTFFQPPQSDIVLWLLCVAAIAMLVSGADRAVTAAVRLARAMGMSTVIIGATVVSLGTTSPEAFTSVTAAFRGQPGLALGNGVGSIIIDTALIFGLCCCITRLGKDRFVLHRHGWLQLAAGVLLAVTLALLAWANGGFVGVVIPRWVGLTFVAGLVGYLWVSVRWARRHPRIPGAEAGGGEGARATAGSVVVPLGVLAFGLAMVLVGSDIMVSSAGELCLRYGVPQSVLAVTLVAFGTSLPELTTAIASIVKGHTELLVGNVIGADILNVLFVIGASAAAVPLKVPVEFYYLHVPVMLVGLVLMRLFIFADGGAFRRRHGAALLAVFGGYYAALLVLVRLGYLKYQPL